MNFFIRLTAIYLLGTFLLFSQSPKEKYSRLGEIYFTKLNTAPFPHPKRAEGHKYDNQFFPPDKHYSDNSVLIFIPKGYSKTSKPNIVVHFHGWWNNIDSVLNQFRLIEQFCESHKDAILIIPEGPKNAPDSFGGKLEDKNGFKQFVSELLDTLYQAKKIAKKEAGDIILSGHSGGYHVISFIVMRGGMNKNIKEIYFFDALYGQTEKIVHWLDFQKGKFVNIYTDSGGTKYETELLMADLDGWGVPYFGKKEVETTPNDLKNNRLIFIHTDLTHNEVLFKNNNFREYLKASCLKDLKLKN